MPPWHNSLFSREDIAPLTLRRPSFIGKVGPPFIKFRPQESKSAYSYNQFSHVTLLPYTVMWLPYSYSHVTPILLQSCDSHTLTVMWPSSLMQSCDPPPLCSHVTLLPYAVMWLSCHDQFSHAYIIMCRKKNFMGGSGLKKVCLGAILNF